MEVFLLIFGVIALIILENLFIGFGIGSLFFVIAIYLFKNNRLNLSTGIFIVLFSIVVDLSNYSILGGCLLAIALGYLIMYSFAKFLPQNTVTEFFAFLCSFFIMHFLWGGILEAGKLLFTPSWILVQNAFWFALFAVGLELIAGRFHYTGRERILKIS